MAKEGIKKTSMITNLGFLSGMSCHLSFQMLLALSPKQ
jgi:hypothetical protein